MLSQTLKETPLYYAIHEQSAYYGTVKFYLETLNQEGLSHPVYSPFFTPSDSHLLSEQPLILCEDTKNWIDLCIALKYKAVSIYSQKKRILAMEMLLIKAIEKQQNLSYNIRGETLSILRNSVGFVHEPL